MGNTSFENKLREVVASISGVESARIVLDEFDNVLKIELSVNKGLNADDISRKVRDALKKEMDLDLAESVVEIKTGESGIKEDTDDDKSTADDVKFVENLGVRYPFDQDDTGSEQKTNHENSSLFTYEYEKGEGGIFTLDGMDISFNDDRVRVRVRIVAGDTESIGLAEGRTTGISFLRTGVRAVMEAVSKTGMINGKIVEYSVHKTNIHEKSFILTGLVLESVLGTKTVAGIEIIEVSPQLSAVKATIEAFNKIVFPSV